MRYILSQEEGHFKYYHLAAWVIPAITTVTGLSLLYLPNAEWVLITSFFNLLKRECYCSCHTSVNHESILGKILPNYIITYTPILVVMVTNPILYKHSIEDMKAIITCTSGQFTSREREILEAIKLKFAVINLVFYVCWLPNLINGCLLWTLAYHLPWESVVMVWYIMVSWRIWKLLVINDLAMVIVI